MIYLLVYGVVTEVMNCRIPLFIMTTYICIYRAIRRPWSSIIYRYIFSWPDKLRRVEAAASTTSCCQDYDLQVPSWWRHYFGAGQAADVGIAAAAAADREAAAQRLRQSWHRPLRQVRPRPRPYLYWIAAPPRLVYAGTCALSLAGSETRFWPVCRTALLTRRVRPCAVSWCTGWTGTPFPARLFAVPCTRCGICPWSASCFLKRSDRQSHHYRRSDIRFNVCRTLKRLDWFWEGNEHPDYALLKQCRKHYF